MAWRFCLILFGLAAMPAGATDLFGDPEQEFLHPDKAFVLVATSAGPDKVQAHFRVAEGYYLYRDKTGFNGLEGTSTPTYTLPAGIVKDDPLFGQVETWSGDVVVNLQWPAAQQQAVLEASYQGCAEKGVCYPPQTKILKVAMTEAVEVQSPGRELPLLSRSDQIAQDLAQEGLLWSFVAFIGFGLLLAFTPCVLPMIPILASVIAGAKGAGTRRAFFLALTYVLAMASTYAVLGIIVGLTGSNLQAAMQNIWVIGAFVLVLVWMALAMFGLYELRLPAALTNRLDQAGRRFQGGSFFGAAIMGLLGALVASPCVSPPLVGALIHIADTGSPMRGAISLFGMGLGLGLPLLVFGACEGRYLPKSGAWMKRVKALFGVLLLMLALWMLDRVVPGQVTLVLSGLLLVMLGVFLRATDSLPADASALLRLGKGAGLVLLLYGAVLLISAATGGHSVLRPWTHFGMVSTVEETPALPFRSIKTTTDLERELQQASGQPVLVDFYADWCVTCMELEAFTFTDPQVQELMRQFVLLRADVTANDDADTALLESLGLFGPPAILFYASDGTEMRGLRTVSFVPPKDFVRHLDEALIFAR